MNLPTSLSAIAQLARAADPRPGDEPVSGDEVTVVTAFFDIGRGAWQQRFKRSADDYFAMFARLAKLRNPMIVFTEPRFAERVLELRRANGLEERTSVVTIANLFECGPVAPVKDAIERRMSALFRRWVLKPESPEYREPCYVLVNALKAAYVCTAIEFGLVATPQVAWIDFGYCRDDKRFDPATTWRFDAGGKINLFHMLELDDTPIYRVVRYGAVYFQGCHIVGPADAWPAFAREMSFCLSALLASDLVDDDQTLLLMAWRANPDRYRIHAVSSADWFVIFRRFYPGAPPETVKLKPGPPLLLESPLMEEIRHALKHVEKQFKRTFKRPRQIYKRLRSSLRR
ncbi:MAG: WlaTC/HtrL family glycosyltransferase [Rhodomicrobium sp.]